MTSRTLPLVAVLAACAVQLRAAEVQAWHGVDIELFQRGAWTLRARGDARWTGRYRELVQYRGGPEIRWSPTGRWTVTGYYQAIEGRAEFDRFDEVNRFFGAFEWQVPVSPRISLWSRSAVERFVGGDGGDFNRYRQFGRFRWRVPLQPWAGCEWLWVRQGLLTVRPQAAFTIPLNGSAGLEIAYIHDRRRPEDGGLRHIIRTELRLRPRR